MFIERNFLNDLNKNIFGGGINQTKRLTPDYERIVPPDPSLPKIKRYNIISNNPLGYMINMNKLISTQSQINQNIPPQNIQPVEEIYSQNIEDQQNVALEEEQKEINNDIIQEEIPLAQEIIEEVPEEKRFKITDLGENNILLPPGYSTDDEDEYKLINIINEPKEKYEFATDSKYAKVYKRIVSKKILFNNKYIS